MNDLTSRFAFFLILLILTMGGVTLSFVFSSNVSLQVVISIICGLTIYFGSRLALFSAIGNNKVRIYIVSSFTALSVLLISTLAFSFSDIIDLVVKVLDILNFNDVGLKLIKQKEEFSGYKYFIISMLSILYVVTVYFVAPRNDTSDIMGRPSKRIKDVLPLVTNTQRLINLRYQLISIINNVDQQTKWSELNFVSLDAEIQILEGKSARSRIVDLIFALKRNPKTKIFIVLGEPGAGKSVALRKLTRDLLDSSKISDRIPIYINLREWKTEKTWTEDNPPNINEFHSFIISYLIAVLDFNSVAFLTYQINDNPKQTLYESLMEAGYFFFIFDSFDEIPAILDHDESSWLIQAISDCIVRYVSSGSGTRCVISSRLFRRPSIRHSERSVLEIRKFSPSQVLQAIDLSANDADRLKQIILTERPDLGIISGNPFSLYLIINYFNLKHSVPNSQIDMFEVFIDENIKIARSNRRYRNLEREAIFSVCEDISWTMFDENNASLDISDQTLRTFVQHKDLDDVIAFLVQSRLARIGGDNNSFSFTHRRFNEYFLVRRLEQKKGALPLDAIQKDSRWRDSLVLYSEIAPTHQAQELFDHGWNYASKLLYISLASDRRSFIESRSALRFIVEAFSNKSDIAKHRSDDIVSLIKSKTSNERTDLLETRCVLEAIPLVETNTSAPLIAEVLSKYPAWLTESVVSASRYFPSLNSLLAVRVFDNNIERLGLIGSIRHAGPLRLSTATKFLPTWFLLYLFDTIKAISALVGLFVVTLYFDIKNIMVCVVVSISILTLITLFHFIVPYFIKLPLYVSDYIRSFSLSGRYLPVRSRLKSENFKLIFGESIRWYNVSLYILAISTVNICALCLIQNIGVFFRRLPDTNMPTHDIVSIEQVSVVIIAALIGVVPVCPAAWNRLKHFLSDVKFWSFITDMTQYLPLILFAMTAIWLGSLIPKWLLDKFEILVKYVSYLVFAFFASVLIVGVFDYLKDYFLLRKVKNNFFPSRKRIQEDFDGFSTAFMRARYVKWLELLDIDDQEMLSNVEDKWPTVRPQIENDSASILLAKLDSRWSGLE